MNIKNAEGSEMTRGLKEMTTLRQLAAAGAVIAIAGSSANAFGESDVPAMQTTESVANILTVQGSARCDQFAIGAEIIELKQYHPGPDFVLTGPLGQKIEAKVSDGTSLQWQATVPVDIVIVRGRRPKDIEITGAETGEGSRSSSSRAAHVYVFGDDPASFDSDETAPGTSAISQVRFCYGLPQEPETLPRCADIDNGPRCPVDDEGVEQNALLATFLFDERDFGGVPQCTCGELVLSDCNENVPSDHPDSCAGGELLELPVQIEAIKNVTDTASTTCKVRRGKRRCRSTND